MFNKQKKKKNLEQLFKQVSFIFVGSFSQFSHEEKEFKSFIYFFRCLIYLDSLIFKYVGLSIYNLYLYIKSSNRDRKKKINILIILNILFDIIHQGDKSKGNLVIKDNYYCQLNLGQINF